MKIRYFLLVSVFYLNTGENCGSKGSSAAIVVDELKMPKVLVLGENATFSGGITVNEERKSVTKFSVVMIKKSSWGHFKVTKTIAQ